MKTYRELLKNGEQKLAAAGIENAAGEAWYLFEDAFSVSKMDYLLDQNRICPEEAQIDKYESYLHKRSIEHVPMQYLLGNQEFMGLSFQVTPDVLIPRLDTEILVEEILHTVSEADSVLDLCTGSGCIILSLAYYGTFQRCIGADISEAALRVAKENGKSLVPMVEFIKSDLFENIKGKYDLIVSNPPYITTEECTRLMPEVRDHEPMLALDGHEDGLYFYQKIISSAPEFLNPGGYLFFEIGYDQGKSVPALMKQAGFTHVVCKKDLAGLDRVVYGRYMD